MSKRHPLSANELSNESEAGLQRRVRNTMKHIFKLTTPKKIAERLIETLLTLPQELRADIAMEYFKDYKREIVEACAKKCEIKSDSLIAVFNKTQLKNETKYADAVVRELIAEIRAIEEE